MDQEIFQICQQCSGSGKRKYATCADCKGTGRVLFGFLVSKEEKAKATTTANDKKEAVADAMTASATALKNAAEAKKGK